MGVQDVNTLVDWAVAYIVPSAWHKSVAEMDLTFDRPSSRGLLSATQPIPKARSLIPLSGRKSFTPVLGGCATPTAPLKNWSATAMLRAQWTRERDEHLSELRLQLE